MGGYGSLLPPAAMTRSGRPDHHGLGGEMDGRLGCRIAGDRSGTELKMTCARSPHRTGNRRYHEWADDPSRA